MPCLVQIKLLFLLLSMISDVDYAEQNIGISFVQIAQDLQWDLSPGEDRHLTISFSIQHGYHIQADSVLDENLIPTSISIKSPEKIIASQPVFPDPASFHLKDMKDEMLVFHDQLDILVPVKVHKDPGIGTYKIEGNLHYQACDSVKCYFPRNLPFEITINVQ